MIDIMIWHLRQETTRLVTTRNFVILFRAWNKGNFQDHHQFQECHKKETQCLYIQQISLMTLFLYDIRLVLSDKIKVQDFNQSLALL